MWMVDADTLKKPEVSPPRSKSNDQNDWFDAQRPSVSPNRNQPVVDPSPEFMRKSRADSQKDNSLWSPYDDIR